MTLLMDGHGVECRDLVGAEKCDNCDPDHKLFQIAKGLAEDNEEPAPAPTNASGGSDEYSHVLNDGTWDDDTLMLVDSDLLTDRHGSASMVPSRNNCQELPTPPITASHNVTVTTGLTIPSNNNPSMGVEIEAAFYNSQVACKMSKVEVLTSMTRFLAGKCFVCWARTGNPNVPKTKDHHFFFSCRLPNERFITNGGGWMALKKRIHFQVPYSHCFKCGLPQGEFMPPTHPEFIAKEKLVCPFEDFTAVLAWAVFLDEKLLKEASKFFTELKPKMKTEDFYTWINEGEGPESFYNALELVMWLWKFRNYKSR
jgi:hypothetical protein